MEIVLRAAAAFVFLWIIVRLVGKRELAQMTAFELLLLVMMGDLIQQGVTQEDYSLAGAFTVVAVFVVLSIALSYASWRFPRTHKLLNGVPVVVVRDGETVDAVMRLERIPLDELHMAARGQGIRDLADVELAVLEPNGSFSFFIRDDGGGSSGGAAAE